MSHEERNKKEIPNISHCRLPPHINDCNYIDSIFRMIVFTTSLQYI